MSVSGYLDSPWPCEDGGPRRLQQPRSGTGLGLRPGESLGCVRRRTTLSTMTLLGAPGEVYLMTHSALRARIGMPTTARVERIDPITLRTLERSPRLAGGPMWPGGMALHRNGCLYLVYGRHAHRLDRHCVPVASRKLPVDLPYNSFVILDNGLIVTKNLSHQVNARLSVLEPERLQAACADQDAPEPSVARLSAIGNTIYVVGVRSIMRYHWRDDTGCLELDDQWRCEYIGTSRQTHGWDVVLGDQHAWFMDNGHHRYLFRMAGAGVARTPNRLIRVSLSEATDHQAVAVSDLPGGSITNPPMVDEARGLVIGYDSANQVLRAWRFDTDRRRLEPLWHKAPFGCASHMLYYPWHNELVVNDYRRLGEEVVVLDAQSGAERARVRVGGIMQGVVFPSPGWSRDLYWSSMGQLARVFVQ